MNPIVRAATPDDMRFVCHAWTKSSYAHLQAQLHKSRQAQCMAYSLYDQLFRTVQARIFKRAKVTTAINPHDESHVLGFMIFETTAVPIVHYVQVKPEFRRKGIAKLLLQDAAISREHEAIYSFGTPLARKVVPKSWVHIPLHLMPELQGAT